MWWNNFQASSSLIFLISGKVSSFSKGLHFAAPRKFQKIVLHFVNCLHSPSSNWGWLQFLPTVTRRQKTIGAERSPDHEMHNLGRRRKPINPYLRGIFLYSGQEPLGLSGGGQLVEGRRQEEVQKSEDSHEIHRLKNDGDNLSVGDSRVLFSLGVTHTWRKVCKLVREQPSAIIWLYSFWATRGPLARRSEASSASKGGWMACSQRTKKIRAPGSPGRNVISTCSQEAFRTVITPI